MKIAGLSIEGTRLRASIVSRRFKVVKKLGAEEATLPQDGEKRAAALREILLKWKEDFGIRGVVLGLDLKHFSCHFIDLPVNSETDIRHALSFEMEKHLPLPPEEYVYDFHTIKAGESGSRNLVLAVRKNRLDWIGAALEGTGLRCLAVRCTGIEALNEFVGKVAARNVVFVYPGGRSYYAFGLGDAVPSEIRTIRADADPVPVLEALSSAYEGGIYAAEAEALRGADGLDIRELSFAVPDILSVLGIEKRAVDMDFTPDELKTPAVDYYTYAVAALATASVLLFFSTSVLSYYKDYSALKKVQARTEEIQSTSRELVEMRKKMEEIDRKRQFLYTFKLRRNRQIDILKQLSVILPDDAWLTGFASGEKGKVELDGYARRSAEIIGPLENSSLFRNVEFSSPVTVRQGKERFSIRMEVEQ